MARYIFLSIVRRLEVGYDNDDGELESLPNFAEAKRRVGCVGDADECFVISRGGKLKSVFQKAPRRVN